MTLYFCNQPYSHTVGSSVSHSGAPTLGRQSKHNIEKIEIPCAIICSLINPVAQHFYKCVIGQSDKPGSVYFISKQSNYYLVVCTML